MRKKSPERARVAKPRQTETKFRSLFEHMLDGFAYCRMLYDGKGRPSDFLYLEVNAAFEKLTGLKDVIGKRASEVIPGIQEAHPELLETYGRVAATRKPERFEVEFKPLGLWLTISVYSPRKHHFVAVFDNITERKRAEQALSSARSRLEQRVQDRTAALQAERWRFRDMLDRLPSYVVLLTPDYHIAFANRVFREQFGDAGDRRCYEALFKRTEPCENCETYKVLQTGAPLQWKWEGPNGRHYDVVDYPFTDVDGQTLILEMGMDETQRKLAEALLLKYRDQLEQLVEQRTRQLEAANAKLQAEIAEHNLTEAELRERKERLNRAEEIAHLGSWELDLTKNCLTWSNEVYRIFGLEPQQFGATYEAFLEAVHPEDRAAVDDAYSSSLREGRDTYEIEHRVIRKSTGEIRVVHEKCHHLRDEQGRIIGSHGMVQDITERKHAEQSLQRYKVLAGHGRDIIVFVRRRDGRVLEANEAAVRAYGYTRQELRSLSIYDLRGPGAFQLTNEQMEAADKVGILFETVHRRKDGTSFPAEVSSRGIVIGKERILLSIVRDITERKQAEQALRKSEERYRTLFNTLIEGFCTIEVMFDEQGRAVNYRFLETNPAFEKQTGLHDVRGKLGTEVVPDNSLHSYQVYGDVARTGEPAHFVKEIKSLHRCFEISAYRVGGPESRKVGILFTDITERKLAEERIRRQNALLQAINRIFARALSWKTDEEWAMGCLIVAQEVTQSKFGFVGELNENGMQDLAVSNPGWDACTIIGSSGHQRPHNNFKLHGIYGRVLTSGKSLIANDPATHPNRIGLPKGHPPLNAFLGVPLLLEGQTIGMVAVGNREGGYTSEQQENLEALAPAIVQVLLHRRAERQRKRAELNQLLLTDILRLLNQGGDLPAMIRGTLRLIRDTGKFGAVGLRLRQGQDFPYFEHNGFSEEFLCEETFLCARDGRGATIRDAQGRPVLECTCGLVLSGKTNPAMPCFTRGGSFWTNVSTELLALPREADPRANPRNRCIHTGYQSIGLFPVRAGQEIIGLLQLNDRQEGRFTPELLTFYESVAQNIGLALQREIAQAALQQAQAKLREHAEELERIVERRTAKLNETVAELEHFSYAIVHDMRAPLRAMQSFAGLLEEECGNCHQAMGREYFRRIKLASNRMDQLIIDSLNYSKAVRQELTLEPIDLANLLKGMVETYPNLQPDKADIEIQGPLPGVLGNEAALTQCFGNLLGNAVKYARPGIKPRIRIRVERGEREERQSVESVGALEPKHAPPARHVRIWVEDNGIGIPRDSLKRIFGIFQRATSKYEGTGIGLAIVQKVVHRMGGQVGVESEEGQGSRFWVQLPKAP